MLKIYSKQITVDKYETETRWFAETEDGFDGTAQGYGYKTKQKLMKAYWYYQNRHKIKAKQNEAKKLVRDHPDLKRALKIFFDSDNCLDAAKNGEPFGMQEFAQSLANETEWRGIEINCSELHTLLQSNKHLWKDLLEMS